MPTAAEQILAKAPMPTPLSSAEIRAEVAEDVRARSLFSACTTEAGYLARLQELLAQAAAGEIDKATFVKRAQDHLLQRIQAHDARGRTDRIMEIIAVGAVHITGGTYRLCHNHKGFRGFPGGRG